MFGSDWELSVLRSATGSLTHYHSIIDPPKTFDLLAPSGTARLAVVSHWGVTG
jgi:hypothetical protein